jgi:SAM-dependent methyltransferase
MTKPIDAPPTERKPGDPSTPAPDVVIDDGGNEGDPTLEWSLSDLPSTDDGADAVPGPMPTPLRIAASSGPMQAVSGDGTERRHTPPPIPVEATLRSGSGPARSSGARPAEAAARSDSDDVLIVETPPSNTPAPRVTADAEPRRTTPTPPAPARPPVPAVAQPSATPPTGTPQILLPDLPVDGGAGVWPEALSQRQRKKRLKPWFEEVFDEDYLRTLPFMTADQTLREVSFIRETLAPPPDGHLLDVACGYGRHAIELAQRGLKVTGVDLSLPLLIRAADESQRRSLSVNFVHADMREMSFDGQFDAGYCVLSSFGYFDEETNLKVASSICRALKPGGRFLIDTLNRDYIVADLPTRVWWEGDGCVVLEEVDFNFHTSRINIRRSVVFSDGRQVEQDISIRAYSLHELGKLMRQAGLRVLDVSGSLATKGHFFGGTSRNIIMLCERPAG